MARRRQQAAAAAGGVQPGQASAGGSVNGSSSQQPTAVPRNSQLSGDSGATMDTALYSNLRYGKHRTCLCICTENILFNKLSKGRRKKKWYFWVVGAV